VVAFGLAVVAAAVLLLAPFGSQQTAVSTTGGGQQVTVVDRSSLLEHEGPSVLLPLAVPVVLALLGMAAARFRRPTPVRTIAAGLLGAFVVLGAMSIGAFFLPSAVALGVAAARTPAFPRTAAGPPTSV
jgi:hypothetical protein